MCQLLHTVADRPSGNAAAERQMRVISFAIRCFIGKNPQNWDKYIPLIASAIRSSLNRHTNYTPNYLMFAGNFYIPADTVCPDNHTKKMYVEDYANELRDKMSEAHTIARDTLKQ